MDYYAVAGMVIVALIAFLGAYYAMRKHVIESNEPISELTKAIIELNVNFKYMLEKIERNDKSIELNDKKIDKIIERQRDNEKILDLHNIRIGNLENAIGKPFVYQSNKEESEEK